MNSIPPATEGGRRARDHGSLQAIQLQKLNQLLRRVRPENQFYARKWAGLSLPSPLSSLEEFSAGFPLTRKDEFVADQAAAPPYGTNLTFPRERFVRCHQTSGSTGAPLRWLDTPESWRAMLDNWDEIFATAGLLPQDRLFFAFSFGPFIGFWSAFESAARRGLFCFPGGAMNSEARLRSMLDQNCTVLFCTPTYALHLGAEAQALGLDVAQSAVRLIITAGEPGGSIPATRARLAKLWPGARVFDHHGMTESGPVTYECPAQPGVLHVIETSFLAEIIDPETGQPAPAGKAGELVLTTLDRLGSPLIRYRSGDLVKPASTRPCACGRHELALQGGIVGRTDDMVVVRGVNVFPGAVENIIRGFKGVAEYRVSLSAPEALTELAVEIEPAPELRQPELLAQRLRCAFHTGLGLRVPVRVVPAGALPRFEMKSRRWVRTAEPPAADGQPSEQLLAPPICQVNNA